MSYGRKYGNQALASSFMQHKWTKPTMGIVGGVLGAGMIYGSATQHGWGANTLSAGAGIAGGIAGGMKYGRYGAIAGAALGWGASRVAMNHPIASTLLGAGAAGAYFGRNKIRGTKWGSFADRQFTGGLRRGESVAAGSAKKYGRQNLAWSPASRGTAASVGTPASASSTAGINFMQDFDSFSVGTPASASSTAGINFMQDFDSFNGGVMGGSKPYTRPVISGRGGPDTNPLYDLGGGLRVPKRYQIPLNKSYHIGGGYEVPIRWRT
jgi:hypothetical protein